MTTGITPAELDRMSGQLRRLMPGCWAALYEWNGWLPDDELDRRLGLYGPQRSNRHLVDDDGRVTISSPYPEPFYALMVLWNPAGRPLFMFGPQVLVPGGAMVFDAATFECVMMG